MSRAPASEPAGGPSRAEPSRLPNDWAAPAIVVRCCERVFGSPIEIGAAELVHIQMSTFVVRLGSESSRALAAETTALSAGSTMNRLPPPLLLSPAHTNKQTDKQQTSGPQKKLSASSRPAGDKRSRRRRRRGWRHEQPKGKHLAYFQHNESQTQAGRRHRRQPLEWPIDWIWRRLHFYAIDASARSSVCASRASRRALNHWTAAAAAALNKQQQRQAGWHHYSAHLLGRQAGTIILAGAHYSPAA